MRGDPGVGISKDGADGSRSGAGVSKSEAGVSKAGGEVSNEKAVGKDKAVSNGGNQTGGKPKQDNRRAKTEKSPLERSLHGRKCVGCGEFAGKKTLIRIVRTKAGEVLTDPTGKANGRGAYLHESAECVAVAKKKRGLERALKCDNKAAEAVYNQLIQAYDK
jgi:predicted RNA-binding protein YlxR (DUF448 family)